MDKAELIEKAAAGVTAPKSDVQAILESTLEAITGALKKGQEVKLSGFGVFRVVKRKARKGRNPKTGEAVDIPASKAPKFSAGKRLKDAVR